MRIPHWLRTELESVGTRVLTGETERKDAADVLAGEILERDRHLLNEITATWARGQLRGWIRSHGRAWQLADDDSGAGGQAELFTWLPPFLETSPGRFARVDTMTGEDWDAALRQAQVKAGNAQNYATAVRRAHDQVRPLLTGEAMTTADIAAQLGGLT